MKPFEPNTLTIAELFGNQDSFYKIPRYQRPYKWQDEQIEQLWDDIYESFEKTQNMTNGFSGAKMKSFSAKESVLFYYIFILTW